MLNLKFNFFTTYIHQVEAKSYAWREILRSSAAHRVEYLGKENKIVMIMIIIKNVF